MMWWIIGICVGYLLAIGICYAVTEDFFDDSDARVIYSIFWFVMVLFGVVMIGVHFAKITIPIKNLIIKLKNIKLTK